MKTLLRIFFLFLIPALFQIVNAQTKDEEIQRLKKLAKENEERAIRAEVLARQYQQEAKSANATLERLRFQALAKYSAQNSIELEDKEQASLLALTALNLLRKGEGYEFDSDIYAGLISALNRYDRFPQSLKFNTETGKFLKESNNIIYTVTQTNQLIAWKYLNKKWQPEELIKVQDGNITSFDIDQSGKQIIISVDDNEGYSIRLFENKPFSDKPKIIYMGKEPIKQIKFVQDGSGFYALINDGNSILYSNLTENKEVIQTKEKIKLIEVIPNATKIAGASESGNLIIWDAKDFSLVTIKVLTPESQFSSLSCLPDNNQLVFGDTQGRVRIFKLSTNAIFITLMGHKAEVNSIAFSRSGKFIATSSGDQTLRVWNLKEINRMPIIIKCGSFGTICFSDDDNQILFSPDKNNSIFALQAWPININKMATELCSFVGRNFTREEWEMFISTDIPFEKVCIDNSN